MPWPMEMTRIAPTLWRSSMPRTPADAGRLRKAGIEAVVSLDEGAPVSLLETAGLEVHRLFTPDTRPPDFGLLDAADAVLRRGRPTVVHCIAGWGRTGSVLSARLALALLAEAPALAPREAAWEGLRAFWRKVPRAEGHMRACGQAENVVRYVEARGPATLKGPGP